MPVFDFSGSDNKNKNIVTYDTFQSSERTATAEKPIMLLENSTRKWAHHSGGKFTNPIKRTAFEFDEVDGVQSADILKIDARFVSLLKWLGENHINVRLSGENRPEGYAVYKIRETEFGGGAKLSANDGFLQFMIERLLASDAPSEEEKSEEEEEEEALGDDMKLTSMQSIIDFMHCAGRTLPDNIRLWARRNLAVARILRLPWTTLDMSSINDPEQLTGSSRVYSNAKPGIIMEAFSQAGESNLVFIINELDKANSGKGNGNPADVLLTLLDNLGFTDNYMECMIPTNGVYPIATANDKENISKPIMSRFAVIDIPDYTPDEKKEIFNKFVLPKVLKRIGLEGSECIILPDGVDAVIKKCDGVTGIRDIEQAAEHIVAHALYQIEVNHVQSVTFDGAMIEELLS